MVRIPERFGRRMSIGPFEDPRDFLRFLCFATAGAFLSMAVGLLWGLPVIAAGLALTLFRVEEESLLTQVVRRTVYLVARARPSYRDGSISAEALRDPWGRSWRFYWHPPFPIYGRTPEELMEESARLVKLISALPSGECLFVRETLPWTLGPFLPANASGDAQELGSYRALLTESIRGRFRARLVLGVPGPSSGRPPSEGLLKNGGWERLSGNDLLLTARRRFPALFGGG